MEPPITSTSTNRSFYTQVTTRFGLLPNFFCTGSAAPGLIDELWGFAKSAYLDNPLPSLFKERLFVYLSRFCRVRYCIVRHVGFLLGKGRPAGDRSATPETVMEIIQLLKRPAPDLVNMDEVYVRLNDMSPIAEIPAPRTKSEEDLFDALAIMFVEPGRAAKARSALKNALGNTAFELVTAYLAFIRTAHYWTETHPEIACEPDMLSLMEEEKELSALLLDTKEAERVQSGDMLRKALNESEERYRTIFNCMGEAFAICEIILNQDGRPSDFRFLELNPAFERVTGIAVGLIVGKTAKEALPATEERWIEICGRVAVQRETVDSEYHSEISNRWFHFFAAPIGKKEDGQFITVFNDITDKKRIEQQREDFLSIASHELKTPVTSIKVYGELLQLALDKAPDTGNMRLVQRMNGQIIRLNNQINDLLDTTRINEGQLHLNYESFNLAESIRTIIEQLRPTFTNHTATVECPEEIMLNGDKKRIEQVITNLISNAVKYSPGGGEISVVCSELPTQIEFSVKDNGIGIPAGSEEKIFNRFYRVQDGGNNGFPGMGLGLFICAGIVDRHGGTIGVRRNPDKGSTFYFTIPKAR